MSAFTIKGAMILEGPSPDMLKKLIGDCDHHRDQLCGVDGEEIVNHHVVSEAASSQHTEVDVALLETEVGRPSTRISSVNQYG